MHNISVLIADDHQLFREGMESLLKRIPYIKHVAHASSGESVLLRMEQQAFDVIFMDIRMPEKNGIDTTRKLKKLYPDVKIIALTMMEDAFNVTSMLKAGAMGYLLKNTSFAELSDALECTLNGERYISSSLPADIRERLDEVLLGTDEHEESKELTKRETEIVRLICKGFSSKDIAELLFISSKTVDSHRTRIYAKLDVANAVDLARYAIENGLLDE